MSRRTQLLRRRRLPGVSGESGAAAVEFALVVPLLFLLVFGIIDFGFGFHSWDASENAAREAARVAAVDPNVNDIVARARASTDFLDQSKLQVAVICSHDGGSTFATCGPSSTWAEGDIVRVTVQYDYHFMTPLGALIGAGSSLHQTAVSEARFEGQ